MGIPASCHPFEWDFPWNKPSSYWGTPMTMEIPILSETSGITSRSSDQPSVGMFAMIFFPGTPSIRGGFEVESQSWFFSGAWSWFSTFNPRLGCGKWWSSSGFGDLGTCEHQGLELWNKTKTNIGLQPKSMISREKIKHMRPMTIPFFMFWTKGENLGQGKVCVVNECTGWCPSSKSLSWRTYVQFDYGFCWWYIELLTGL